MPQTPIDPLTRYIEDEATGCWLWQGAVGARGYGNINRAGKTWTAHRYFYHAHRGDVPAGMVLMHHCDNRKCVNPWHLTPGGQSQNVKDAYGRGTRKHTPMKLTEAEVLAIRARFDTIEGMAKRLGITRSMISKILAREAWAHIPPGPYESGKSPHHRWNSPRARQQNPKHATT